MGKGDQKSKRGKINAGSYGKRRPRKSSKPAVVAEQVVKAAAKEEKPKVAAKPKAEKAEEIKEAKPKATKAKKTED